MAYFSHSAGTRGGWEGRTRKGGGVFRARGLWGRHTREGRVTGQARGAGAHVGRAPLGAADHREARARASTGAPLHPGMY